MFLCHHFYKHNLKYFVKKKKTNFVVPDLQKKFVVYVYDQPARNISVSRY